MNAPDALEAARAVQAAAADKGFDWPDITGVFAKVREEIAEVEQAWEQGDIEHTRHELGDLLFAVVNLSRFLDESPSEALEKATQKFSRRFSQVEQIFECKNIRMKDCSIDTLDEAWEIVKRRVDPREERGLDI